MKLEAKVVLFFVAVVPCLPLLCIAVVLLQHRPLDRRAVARQDSWAWEAVPKQLLGGRNEGTYKELDLSTPELAHPHVSGVVADDPHVSGVVADDPHVSGVVADDVDHQTLLLSESLDIDVRGKFQQDRISKMCRKHFFSREQRLPRGDDLPLFFRHLMFDDNRKALFCFVPKIGCTDMKRLMLYMGGHLPMDTVDWPWVEDKIYLEPALAKTSLLNRTLLLNEKVMRLKTYYKFMIVRNPLERLVSAYRNKIEGPVSYKNQDKFPNTLKVQILEQYHDSELQYWRKANSEGSNYHVNISATFSDFVRHFIETGIMTLNDHYRPSIDICHPCIAKYDFYGNFRNFSSDVAQLIKKLRTEPRFYRDKSLHSSAQQTSKLLAQYYSQLSHRDRVRLLGKLYDDLLFYYTLYPAERHSHYHLLGIHHPII